LRGVVTSKGIVTHGFSLEEWDEAIGTANARDALGAPMKPRTCV